MEQKEKVNLLIFIRACIEQEKMDWEDATKLYFDKTNEEITKSNLKDLIFQVNFDYLDADLFKKYSDENSVSVSWPEKAAVEQKFNLSLDIKKAIEHQSLLFAITDKDLKEVFEIDMENDSPEVARNKIDRKLADTTFLLKYLKYDPGLYEIKRIISGVWDTPVKLKQEGGDDKLVQVHNKKFSIEIIRREKPFVQMSPEEYKKYLKATADAIGLGPFVIPKKEESKLILNPDRAIVVPGLELHLGKLGTVADYEDYSIKHAMARLVETCMKLIDYQLKQRNSSLIMSVGNDFFNSDNPFSTTTKGTQQNDDTRFREMYVHGQVGFVKMIETLKEYFDKISIKHCPGNHDEKSIFDLYTSLYQLYSAMKDEIVEIGMSYEDIRPATGQVFGDNFIAFHHGQRPDGKAMNDKQLGDFINQYFPDETRSTKRTYILAGHIHQDGLTPVTNKITVIRTAALSGTDSWHVDNGYLGQREGHVFCTIDKKYGLTNLEFVNIDHNAKTKGISRKPKANLYDEIEKSLNLNPTSSEQFIAGSNIELIERLKEDKNKEFTTQLSSILGVLGKGINDLSEKELIRLKDILGYASTMSRYNECIQYISQEVQTAAKEVKGSIKKKSRKGTTRKKVSE